MPTAFTTFYEFSDIVKLRYMRSNDERTFFSIKEAASVLALVIRHSSSIQFYSLCGIEEPTEYKRVQLLSLAKTVGIL